MGKGELRIVAEMFDSQHAADYLGISRRTLDRLVEAGQLEAYQLGATRAYFRDELDAYLSSLSETGVP